MHGGGVPDGRHGHRHLMLALHGSMAVHAGGRPLVLELRPHAQELGGEVILVLG